MKAKRIFLVLAAVAVMVAAIAVPAMAQNADKAANRAANKAARQAQKATAGNGGASVAPSNAGTQKALPSSGGMPVGDIAFMDAGALLVGGGILLHRKSVAP